MTESCEPNQAPAMCAANMPIMVMTQGEDLAKVMHGININSVFAG